MTGNWTTGAIVAVSVLSKELGFLFSFSSFVL